MFAIGGSMTALAIATRAAYPLGKPSDRDRYGMTADQACLYRWLVKYRPHDRPFSISFRATAPLFCTTHTAVFHMVQNLIERGWLERDDAGYQVCPAHHVVQPKERKVKWQT
jgi:hypothetical protein